MIWTRQSLKKNLLVLLALLLALFTLPGLSQAQEPVALELLEVTIWPEFDQPAALVFLSGAAVTGGEEPVELRFELPPGATLNAVAYRGEGNLLSAEYEQQGDEVIVTSPNGTFWVEYYDELTFDGGERSYGVNFTAQHDINTLVWTVQTPYGGTDMRVDPAEGGTSQTGQNGLPTFTVAEENIAAGDEVSLAFSYTKSNDTLSAEWLSQQGGGGAEEAVQPAVTTTGSQPATWVVVLLLVGGLALVGGGVYWFVSQSNAKPGRTRRTRAKGGKGFCTQCGKSVQGGDKFCRHCGAKLG